jgi:uncharacterized protein
MLTLGLTHNHLNISERFIVLKRLPESLHGLRLVQISDLHFYEHSDPAYFERVKETVNRLNPDLLLLTGDVVHIGSAYAQQAGEFLKTLTARFGRFAILGNHDYDDGHLGRAVTEQLARAGFTLLKNSHQSVEILLENNSDSPHHHAPCVITLAGLDDLWYGKPDIEKTLAGIPATQLVIMLAHNPLLFDPVSMAYPGRVDLLLAGHTHAGHVYIPFLQPIYRRIFRMKYRYGMFQKKGTQMHVTSGIGSAAFAHKKSKTGFLPFRWNTYPEIAVLTLQTGDWATKQATG